MPWSGAFAYESAGTDRQLFENPLSGDLLMKYFAKLEKREIEFEVDGEDGRTRLSVDGTTLDVRFKRTSHQDRFFLLMNNRPYELYIERDGDQYVVDLRGRRFHVVIEDEKARALRQLIRTERSPGGITEVRSPMPGLILEVLVGVGDKVQVGDPLVVIEAMKMENVIRSETAGAVKKISRNRNDSVEKGAILMVIE